MKTLRIGHLYALASACLGTIFFVCYDQIVETIDVLQFVFLLFSFSLLFNTLIALIQRLPMKLNRESFIAGIGFASLSILGNYANGQALKLLHPAITVILQRTQIFFVIALTYFFLKEKISKPIIISAALTLIGVIVIQSATNPNWDFANKGILWGVSTALFFGSAQVLIKKYINTINPTTVNIIRLIFAIIILAINPILWSRWQIMTSQQLLLIIICALVGPTASRLCLFHALRTISAAETVLISMLTPFFLLIIMYSFFSQAISIKELLGGLIILAAVIYATFNNQKSDKLT